MSQKLKIKYEEYTKRRGEWVKRRKELTVSDIYTNVSIGADGKTSKGKRRLGNVVCLWNIRKMDVSRDIPLPDAIRNVEVMLG